MIALKVILCLGLIFFFLLWLASRLVKFVRPSHLGDEPDRSKPPVIIPRDP